MKGTRVTGFDAVDGSHHQHRICPISTALEEREESACGYKQTSSRRKLRSAYPPTSDIIGLGDIRVERRIEIDQVNALGRDAVAENLEIVTVVERLHCSANSPVWCGLRSRQDHSQSAGLDGKC